MEDQIREKLEQIKEESEAEAVAAVEAQAEEEAKEAEEAAEAAEEVTEEAVEEVPEYTPDYSYSVYDEQKEFDDRIKEYIKTPEDEEYFRDIFTRADGIDGVKSKLQKEREESAKYYSELNQIQTNLANFDDMIKKNDLETFFATANIPNEKVLEYAINYARRQEMDPADRAAFDRNAADRQHNYQMQSRLDQLEKQREEDLLKQKDFELDQSISAPEISPVSSEWDKRYGNGAFRDEVIKEGLLYHQKNGRQMTINEAVTAVSKRLGTTMQPIVQQGAKPKVVTTITQNKETIPNPGAGDGASPTSKMLRTDDEFAAAAAAAMRRDMGR